MSESLSIDIPVVSPPCWAANLNIFLQSNDFLYLSVLVTTQAVSRVQVDVVSLSVCVAVDYCQMPVQGAIVI